MKKNIKGGRIKNVSIGEVIVSSLINKLGIKLDEKSIENFNNLMNNNVLLEKLKSGLKKFTNEVIVPSANIAVKQMEKPVNDGINKTKAAALNIPVSIIPGISEVFNTTKALSNTATAGLNTATAVAKIATNSIEQVNKKITGNINTGQNAVAGNLNAGQNTAEGQVNAAQNDVPVETAQNAKLRGGGAVISRIKKSVKNFMGKNKESDNKESDNKESTNKKIKKTSKNITMKGGTYNKNKNNIISQKGGQILSRINESLKTFNNIHY
jgi:hypothetical protein